MIKNKPFSKNNRSEIVTLNNFILSKPTLKKLNKKNHTKKSLNIMGFYELLNACEIICVASSGENLLEKIKSTIVQV